jgi:hypothetical protein
MKQVAKTSLISFHLKMDPTCSTEISADLRCNAGCFIPEDTFVRKSNPMFRFSFIIFRFLSTEIFGLLYSLASG